MICQVSARKKIPGAGIAEFHTPTRAHALLLNAAWLQRMVGNICEISLFIKRLFEYSGEKELGVSDPDNNLI